VQTESLRESERRGCRVTALFRQASDAGTVGFSEIDITNPSDLPDVT